MSYIRCFNRDDVTDCTCAKGCIEAIGIDQLIPANSTKTIHMYNVGGYKAFNIYNVVASSGVPEVNFESVDQRGRAIHSQSMAWGIWGTRGINANIKIINNEAIDVTVSYVIFINEY